MALARNKNSSKIECSILCMQPAWAQLVQCMLNTYNQNACFKYRSLVTNNGCIDLHALVPFPCCLKLITLLVSGHVHWGLSDATITFAYTIVSMVDQTQHHKDMCLPAHRTSYYHEAYLHGSRYNICQTQCFHLCRRNSSRP